MRAVPIAAAFVVGAASFTLSFFAQSAVAAELGAVPGQWSWLVPIIVDGGVLAGSASVWSSSTRGSRKDPVAYLTIVGLLALSVIVNVHHAAASGGALGAVIAGSPPVVLLLCLELVAAQARRAAVDAAEGTTPQNTPAATPALAPHPAPTQPATPAPHPGGSTLGSAQATHPDSTPKSGDAPRATAEQGRTWAPAPTRAVAAAVATSVVAATERVPGAELGPAPAPALTRPSLTVVSQRVAPDAPKVAAAGTQAGPVSQADQIRALVEQHVNSGGDLADSSLGRSIADELGVPLPSVRKVLARARKDAVAPA